MRIPIQGMTRRLQSKVWSLVVASSLIATVQSLRAQDDTLNASFNADQVHISNTTLERLETLIPSLRPNNFIRSYSPFDIVSIPLQDNRISPLFRGDLLYRFGLTEKMLSIEYGDTTNHVFAEPLAGLRANLDDNGVQNWTKSYGFKIFGNLGSSFSFYMKAVDNGEQGSAVDPKRELQRSDGIVVSNYYGTKSFDFDETEGQIGLKWGIAQFFVEKIRNVWGYGNDGQVIFSRKAPSYPQIRLVLSLKNHLKFTYIHASLFSDVVDSLQSYGDPANFVSYRKVFRSKYMVAHLLEYAPSDDLNFALGESMIYSDRFEPSYLIPFIFFKSIERQTRDTDNAQIFAGMRYAIRTGGYLYIDFFIDDLNTGTMFSKQNTNIIAGTIGGRFSDVGVKDLDVTLEYTRINPWVYTHKYDATTYTSNSLTLGHWLGQNAELLYVASQYRSMRQLSLGLTLQHILKGPLGPETIHYTAPWDQALLDAPLFRQTLIGLHAQWEPYRGLIVRGEATLATQSDDAPFGYQSYSNKFMMNVGVVYNLFDN